MKTIKNPEDSNQESIQSLQTYIMFNMCVILGVYVYQTHYRDSTHIEVRALPGLLAPGVRSMLPWVPLVANSQLSAFRAGR